MFFNVSAGACRGGRTFWKAGAPCGDPVRLPFTGLVLASGRLVEAYCVGVALMALGPLIHTYYDTVPQRAQPSGRYARANAPFNTTSSDKPPPDNRTCYNCGKVGHINRVCRSPRIGNGYTYKPDPNFH